MRCRECESLLTEYLDGLLDGAAAEDVRIHLDSCVQCRADFQMVEKAHQSLEFVSVAAKAQSVTRRPALAGVRARIAEEERKTTARRRWIWVPVPALAVAGLVLVAMFLNSGPGSSPVANNPAAPSGSNAVPAPEKDMAALAPEPSTPHPPITSEAPAALMQTATADTGVGSAVQAVRNEIRQRISSQPRKTAKSGNKSVETTVLAAVAATSQAQTAPVETPEQPAPSKVMVVAYHPPVGYSMTVQDPQSGAKLGEVSVQSAFKSDGSVSRAEVILHFPSAGAAGGEAGENNGFENDRSEGLQDFGPGVIRLIGRV